MSRPLAVSALVLLSTGLALSGCAGTSPSALDAAVSLRMSALETYGLSELPPTDLIEVLEATPVDERPAELVVSVRPTEVVVQPGERDEKVLSLEEDDFYLSVAPFVSVTHDCVYHSLTTCIGELRNTPISVDVVDLESGETILTESTETEDNGFTGLWLPRDGSYEIEIEAAGKSGSATVSTGEDDPTCLTTLRLE